MKNSIDEKMTEIIIGEAVTELLISDMDISRLALFEKLRSTRNVETDKARIRAGLLIIEEVRREVQANISESRKLPHDTSVCVHEGQTLH